MFAGLLQRVDRELQRNPARIPHAGSHPVGQLNVMPVAGHEIAAGLGDADDRTSGL
jgi:hypothetical protein